MRSIVYTYKEIFSSVSGVMFSYSKVRKVHYALRIVTRPSFSLGKNHDISSIKN